MDREPDSLIMNMLIDGEPAGAISGKTFEVRDPATGSLIETVPLGDAEDVKKAVDAASDAFPGWSALLPRDRAKTVFKAAQLTRSHVSELATFLTTEQGKPFREAKDEIQGYANVLEYYCGLASSVRGDFMPVPGGRQGFTIKKPIGVCGAILPWNVPAILMAWKIAPALIAGNTVILKPASTTPLTNLKLASILMEAGLPKGVLNVVTGPGSAVGEEILRNPTIRKISFTGETSTGKHVMEVASKTLKRVTLELGGSDAMIVCDDADIEAAAEGAVRNRFYNCGQTCTSVKRVFVFDKVADEFIRKCEAKVRALKVGPGMEPGVDMGPINNPAQREKVIGFVETAKGKEEGVLVAGGSPLKGAVYEKGLFYQPTLIKDVAHDSVLMKEEVFGPILPVVNVRDMDEAIERANDSRYGLGSSVWTKSLERAMLASNRLETGITWINQHTKVPPEVPFGGVKESGIGRENGPDALDNYLEIKSVLVNI